MLYTNVEIFQKRMKSFLNGQSKLNQFLLEAYNFWSKIKFMVSNSPYPRLISNTPLCKPSPCIPPNIVMIRVVICIWEISDKQHCLSLCWVQFIVRKCLVWIIALTKIPCKQCTSVNNKHSIVPCWKIWIVAANIIRIMSWKIDLTHLYCQCKDFFNAINQLNYETIKNVWH